VRIQVYRELRVGAAAGLLALHPAEAQLPGQGRAPLLRTRRQKLKEKIQKVSACGRLHSAKLNNTLDTRADTAWDQLAMFQTMQRHAHAMTIVKSVECMCP